MKGRQPGRPTKYVKAEINEPLYLGRPGMTFEDWEKWKRNGKKIGTLTVSVGGLRWRPNNGKLLKQVPWDKVAAWLEKQPTKAKRTASA